MLIIKNMKGILSLALLLAAALGAQLKSALQQQFEEALHGAEHIAV